MSSYGSGRTPNLTLQLDGEDGVTGDFFSDYDQASPDSAAVAQPKSPGGGKLGSFFGWNSAKQLGADSPTTTFSDKSFSPSQSPAMRNKPSGLDIPKANGDSYFSVPGTPLYSSSPHMNAHVEQLERELREVSMELAGSIRREMDLEDEIERWKSEIPAGVSDGRRTSDYYSDSGASSGRYPIGDSEMRIEALEKLRRKVEQEKAQAKVDTAQRLQDELRRRADLEAQVHSLQEQLQEQSRGQNDSERVVELEAALEDARRRVADERLSKENFQDLLTALRQEHKHDRNERDNLRDEVIPSLQSRLEGLEAEAAKAQTLAYENTRMQQELHMLRTEQMEGAEEEAAQQQHPRFSSIQEDDIIPAAATPKIGLSRSNSLARHSVTGPKRSSRGGSLSRSNSVKEKAEAVREIVTDRTKDVEDQRDALHRALKNLVIRHDVLAKQHAKKVRLLEMERDRLLNATPRRTAFHTEVSNLRDEINDLRRRADDALDQKFQCEKNLGGLRMDLGRAEQETTSLRDLLQEHDIFIPERRSSAGSIYDAETTAPVTLEKAYKELQTTHALSLAYMIGSGTDHADVIMSLLKQSISDAEEEREQAIREAEQYREQARALDVNQFSDNQASEIYAAATRMDQLVMQVQEQLHSNMALKQRLAEAIGRGEREQQMSATRVTEMQSKLRTAEDQVMTAQHHSEYVVSKHEDEVRDLEESHSAQLQRMKSGLLLTVDTIKMSHLSTPLSPMFATRSPKLDRTTSGLGMSMTEAARKENLQVKVHGLERALNEADREMEEVVSRMNMAQIEVAELQAER
ncbi:hypothetical protein K490DRAFT_47367 [Saccharata proteae CBS 121410]|uniref:DUF7603 domain-containing protein n=1 Tax=Saccharata proteae CBS 121410 TaxID=1314787 RepID=A0A9P4HTV0_9PEZI|nr:hypothetical protein K490DRAFT_47367 [Saccharata proteae CBS 121410]